MLLGFSGFYCIICYLVFILDFVFFSVAHLYKFQSIRFSLQGGGGQGESHETCRTIPILDSFPTSVMIVHYTVPFSEELVQIL